MSARTPESLTVAIMAEAPCESSGWTEEKILATIRSLPDLNDQTLIDAAGNFGRWLIDTLALSGRWRVCYENGTRRADTNFENGKRHGRWRWWDEGGKRREDANYEHGKLHGRCREWDANGKPLVDVTYKNGVEVQP